MTQKDFGFICDFALAPILIAKKIEGKKNIDFEVCYTNKAFAQFFPNLCSQGKKFSDFSAKLSKDEDFLRFAQIAFNEKNPICQNFYSVVASRYVCSFINCWENYVTFTFFDSTPQSEDILQLKRQNERLAMLTKELYEKCDHLKNKA